MTRIRQAMTLASLLSAVLATTLLWGCGRYGPPVRPQKSAPAEPALEKPVLTAPEANPPEDPQEDEEEKSQ